MAIRKRVAFFCVDTIGGGGTEVWVRNLIANLPEQYKVILVSGSFHADLNNHVHEYVHIRLPSRPAFLRVTLYSLLSTIYPLEKHDLVHVVGAITFRRSDLNSVHFYHKENFRLRRFTIYGSSSKIRQVNRIIYTAINILMERVIFKRSISKKLATVSPEMQNLLCKDLKREVFLTHNGIAPSQLSSDTKGGSEIFLLFVGGDWGRKGLSDVIRTLGILKQDFPTLELVVAGSGQQSAYLSLARELDVHDNIRWLGEISRDKIPYAKNSILVSASHFEVSPLIYLEAAMCGAPIVAYPVFGTSEASEDGYLKICKPDPMHMALSVSEMVSNQVIMQQMSDSGLRIRTKRTIANMVLETTALYFRS